MTRYVVTIVGLTLAYALALGSFYPLDLLFGAGLSAALVVASRQFVFGDEPGRGPSFLRRVAAFVPFSFAVFREVVAGTWEVTLVTLHLRPLKSPGIVQVPIGERTQVGVAVWALITGLAPGTFFVEVDEKRRVVLIHVIDAGDPEAFRRKQEDFYRRYQRGVFP
jgi:multicomponent Na+:H+ antiporter subunit E